MSQNQSQNPNPLEKLIRQRDNAKRKSERDNYQLKIDELKQKPFQERMGIIKK